MRGDGLFSTFDDAFADFLSRAGSASGFGEAFPARNFLLDEGVLLDRAASYRDSGAVADHAHFEAWGTSHGVYLGKHIRLGSDAVTGATVDPSDAVSCPETFRCIDPASRFLHTDLRLDLLRVERTSSVSRRAGVSEDHLLSTASSVVAGNWVRDRAYALLDETLGSWFVNTGPWPVFAGFWQDVHGLFGATPAEDEPGWADRLRDRLGLLHHDPADPLDPGSVGKPIDVLILRYPVEAVPHFRGDRDRRPLVPPTVLDGDLSPPFCPAPRGTDAGHTVDLSEFEALLPQPCREVLHPHIRFAPEHVWRVGRIERPVRQEALPPARKWHLECVRDKTGRPDYAAETDQDLPG
jgi:hypothetical protein